MSAFTLGVIAAAVRRASGTTGPSSVLLLLHGDGSGVTDSSSFARTAEVSGVSTSTAVSGYMGSSQLRIASGDFASWPGLRITELGSYTLEGFFTFPSFNSPRSTVFGCWSNVGGEKGWTVDLDSSGEFQVAVNGLLATPIGGGSASVTTGARHHIAAIVTIGSSSTGVDLYIDGTIRKSFSGGVLANLASTSDDYKFRLGMRSDSSLPVDAYCDEFRVSNIARTIVVPTTPYPDETPTDALFSSVKLLMHADTALTDSSSVARTLTAANVGVSTAQAKFGAGSAASTSSPPQLSVASSTDFATAGDWTLEFFIRCSAFGTQRYFLASGPTQYFSLSVGGQLTAPGWQSDFAQNLTLNTWHYVKLVHLTDGTCKCYFDGTLISTQTGFTGSSSGTALDIFGVPGRSDLTGFGDGWIDEVRFTRAARDTTGVPSSAFADS